MPRDSDRNNGALPQRIEVGSLSERDRMSRTRKASTTDAEDRRRSDLAQGGRVAMRPPVACARRDGGLRVSDARSSVVGGVLRSCGTPGFGVLTGPRDDAIPRRNSFTDADCSVGQGGSTAAQWFCGAAAGSGGGGARENPSTAPGNECFLETGYHHGLETGSGDARCSFGE